ncbi:hypothetical protein GOD80_25875 [Sinorhizobium medicae]|nr:hypothetical protein [Sinorhizobium medicae]MDX0590155.1 hypothetical protein [Sinorhizobium medicae]MDX0808591.1 hypothetical protein [Sinorhizobium medicae]MDX2385076.1 hypothetical protein [Sinorhizobium medicae]
MVDQKLSPPLQQFAAYLGRRFAEEKARVRAEVAVAIRDIREVQGEQSRTNERLVRKAAERMAGEIRGELRRDFIRLSAELETARREIEAMKAERGNVRAIR